MHRSSIATNTGRVWSGFKRTIFRGVAVVLPPLLTLVILIGVWNVIRGYLLEPAIAATGEGLAFAIEDIRYDLSEPKEKADGKLYVRLPDRSYIPAVVHETVRAATPPAAMPDSAKQFYRRYVEIQYLRPQVAIPVLATAFVLLMYLVGRFLAARLGRFVLQGLERLIQRVPLVRSVYSSVKRVTDLMLNEDRTKRLRVVAVQYPRPGAWAVAFVTGDGLEDISEALGEPTLSLLVPTSPKAVTGFIAVVPKSRTVELNLSLEEAFKYLISCGVVGPSEKR